MPHVDLLDLPYFEGLSLDDLVTLVDLLEPRQFSPGTIILAERSIEPGPLYIATAGSVRITKKNPKGLDIPLAELKSPTLFGEIELFCEMPPVATVTATTEVAAFVLDRRTFDKLLGDKHPALLRFTYNMAKVACHRLAICDDIMARSLGHEDLIALRRQIFSSMAPKDKWAQTTGMFKLPNFTKP
ncbi:MAG: cyclic nucleotide-binding domain-containing protein [Myxococcota bacterium]|jgi:CRP-like cAMP-binding protein|nr:cyclic nucleotide-binding domain-containing protein [Myxococcota bacterium]